MAIDLKIDSKAVQGLLKKGPGALERSMRAGGNRIGARFVRFHRKERLRGGEGIKGTPKGLVRRRKFRTTGSGLGSLVTRIWVQRGVPARIAGEHEVGATLLPRRGPFLILPMPAAKTKAGKVKRSARRLLEQTRHAFQAGTGVQLRKISTTKKGKQTSRRVNSLFTLRSRDGRLYLAKPNRGGRPTLMFHLQSRVQLRERFGWFDTWKKYRPQLVMEMNRALKFALRAMAGRRRR